MGLKKQMSAWAACAALASTWLSCSSEGSAGYGAGGVGAVGGVGGTGGDCNCRLGAYFPVCGTDGKTYDAACGTQCVPVPIACNGECPCQDGGQGGTGGGTGGSGGSPSGTCPAQPPTAGSSCTAPWTATNAIVDAHCSWGDDPRPSCRTTATCQNATWIVNQPDATLCSAPPLPASCPQPPPSDTTPCSDATVACWYGDGTRCWCSECQGGSGYPSCQIINPPQWYCATPGTGCPTTMPQAGTPCSSPGASCGPDCQLEIVCEAGVWQWRQGNCPICAAPDTPIATPAGDRAIASLHAGDLVYSVDRDAIVAVPLLRVSKTRVGVHRVMRIVLASGAVLEVSPGHPTADGRIFGDLKTGSHLDPQHEIVSAELVSYQHDATYDVLPSSSTGTYFAAGALIGSTLFERR